ncbi:MAG TPA: 16S rRNA (guanine(527)-N(7))-methyltransferase RsmG [Ignavibacteria bacterium]|nr:16S rRNA (guanine(527)-N(7))-methyltransferase RsmG [Ignavibacteria bacterium]
MELLRSFLNDELGFNNVDDKIGQFKQYEKLVFEWNDKINLVSRKTESIEKYIIGSIYFLKDYPLKGNEKIVDVGTGGGLPGIPLKLLYPELDLLLIDSIAKKINAVRDMINRLSLTKIDAITGRAEDFADFLKYEGKFDYVTAKAVTTLANLYKFSHKFLKLSGKFLCLKGGDLAEELNELSKKYPEVQHKIIDFSFPEKYGLIEKKLVILQKD